MALLCSSAASNVSPFTVLRQDASLFLLPKFGQAYEQNVVLKTRSQLAYAKKFQLQHN